jgi:hypothetical protein
MPITRSLLLALKKARDSYSAAPLCGSTHSHIGLSLTLPF